MSPSALLLLSFCCVAHLYFLLISEQNAEECDARKFSSITKVWDIKKETVIKTISFIYKTFFLKVECKFCKQTHSIETHLHRLPRTAGFIIERFIACIWNSSKIRMHVKQIICTNK